MYRNGFGSERYAVKSIDGAREEKRGTTAGRSVATETQLHYLEVFGAPCAQVLVGISCVGGTLRGSKKFAWMLKGEESSSWPLNSAT